MSEHTKGRLHQCSHSDKRLRDEGGEWVADTDTARRKQEECSANARRLAAAWNAFDGVRTEFIEAMAGTGAMQAASDSMSSLPAALSELNAANERIAKLETLVGERDAMLGKRPCQNSRCNELNAAYADLETARKRDEEWHEHTTRKALELSDVVAERESARALLREVYEEGNLDIGDQVSKELDSRIHSYLDACDTLEGK